MEPPPTEEIHRGRLCMDSFNTIPFFIARQDFNMNYESWIRQGSLGSAADAGITVGLSFFEDSANFGQVHVVAQQRQSGPLFISIATAEGFQSKRNHQFCRGLAAIQIEDEIRLHGGIFFEVGRGDEHGVDLRFTTYTGKSPA